MCNEYLWQQDVCSPNKKQCVFNDGTFQLVQKWFYDVWRVLLCGTEMKDLSGLRCMLVRWIHSSRVCSFHVICYKHAGLSPRRPEFTYHLETCMTSVPICPNGINILWVKFSKISTDRKSVV